MARDVEIYRTVVVLLMAVSILGSGGSERMNPRLGDVPDSPLTYSLKQNRISLDDAERSGCCFSLVATASSPFAVVGVSWLVVVAGMEARCCDKSGILDLWPEEELLDKVEASVGVEVVKEEGERVEIEEVTATAIGVALTQVASSCCFCRIISVRSKSGLLLALLVAFDGLSTVSTSTGSVSRLEALGFNNSDKVSVLPVDGEAGAGGVPAG